MIKRFIAIAAVILLSVVSLFGCGGDNYSRVEISGAQDTTYTVVGNGGSAVQYGNYVYFINGTRGYEDADATANIFGEVIKGAVYRAELVGEKSDGDFIVSRDTVTLLGLKSHKETDYKNDEVDVVDVQRIAPKTVGTSGYSGGGLFIYDNCLYYASPNNLKNKTGDVQYLKTDFFRMTLDGRTTQKIYTTESDSATSPYAFYAQGGFVYLSVLDGTDLISVKINKQNGKKEDTIKVAEDVTAAIMPVKPVYYSGISENTIYDFIYFERAATQDDVTQSGEILEFVRPDGSNRNIFEATSGASYTLETVRDGYLFYRKAINYSTTLVARNLHGALMSDEGYAEDELNANNTEQERIVYNGSGLDSLSVYPFISGYEFGKPEFTNAVSVLTYTQASSDGSSTTITLTLFVDGVQKSVIASASALTIDTVYGNRVYYTADGTLYGADLSTASDPITIASEITTGTYGADVAGGYLVYFSNVADDATGYTYFYEIDGLEGNNDPLFVGEIIEDEQLSKTESLTIIEQPSKTQYTIGEKIDLTGLVIEANFYRDSEGERPDSIEIEITDDMISGFDSSAAGDITVTVTYDKKTVDFTVTILEGESPATSSCSTVAPISPWFFIGGGGILILAAGAMFIGKRKFVRA